MTEHGDNAELLANALCWLFPRPIGVEMREAAQFCGISYSTFRERMHRCKADEDDEHNGNIGS